MTSLAEIAMEHARQRLTGQCVGALQNRGNPVIKTPTSAVPKISTTSNHVEKTEQAAPAVSEISTGPISRHLFLEGRAWAVDMVASLKSEQAVKVIERLAGATAGKPASYVAGVQSVIQVLASAVHGESGVLSTKVPCGSGDLSTKPVPGTELEVRPCA